MLLVVVCDVVTAHWGETLEKKREKSDLRFAILRFASPRKSPTRPIAHKPSMLGPVRRLFREISGKNEQLEQLEMIEPRATVISQIESPEDSEVMIKRRASRQRRRLNAQKSQAA